VGLRLLRPLAGRAALEVVRVVRPRRERRVALVVLAGDDGRAVANGCLAPGDDPSLHRERAVLRVDVADLDQTHAATGDDRQRLVPAVVRHEPAGEFRGLHAVQLPVADLDRLVVDVNGRHYRILFSFPLASDCFNSLAVIFSTPFAVTTSPPRTSARV